MYRSRIPSVEYVAANTDAQALAYTEASIRLRVGDRIAGGLGVGGNPQLGSECFMDSREEIREVLSGADLVFIAAGMGGGTGTGGAPVVANIAKRELGCLTIGVVTKPFPFEGYQRDKQAVDGLQRLAEEVDTMIVIPNERLLLASAPDTSVEMAFRMADEVLRQGIQSITELLLLPGEINLDFADLRTVMRDAGAAWMAIGKGTGIDRTQAAITSALRSPLLEVSIDGAMGVLLNITSGPDLMMAEVRKISETVKQQVHPDAEIIFGTTQDLRMENELKITIIATGFEGATAIDAYTEQTVRRSRDAIPDRSDTGSSASNLA
jgi:cell division protein FtsZ